MGINGFFLSYPERYKTGPIGENRSEIRSALRKNDVQKHSGSQLADGVEISSDAREMLRIMVSKFEADTDDTMARDLTIQNTNEIAWDHYTTMRGISSLALKDGNYTVEDVMRSIMDAYEIRYHEVVKGHEIGDREVSYELTGKRSLALEEDLAGLDEAFKMRLANLAGYITCQQTNKAFENPDSSWYFHRNNSWNERNTKDSVPLFDTEYRDLAVSVMEQAREEFLTAFKSVGYEKGMGVSILSDILNKYDKFEND